MAASLPLEKFNKNAMMSEHFKFGVLPSKELYKFIKKITSISLVI